MIGSESNPAHRSGIARVVSIHARGRRRSPAGGSVPRRRGLKLAGVRHNGVTGLNSTGFRVQGNAHNIANPTTASAQGRGTAACERSVGAGRPTPASDSRELGGAEKGGGSVAYHHTKLPSTPSSRKRWRYRGSTRGTTSSSSVTAGRRCARVYGKN